MAHRARLAGLPPVVSGFVSVLVQGRVDFAPGEYASSFAPFDLHFERFDMAERFFALRGLFEWRIAVVAREVLKPGDVVFEGGAQLGTETFVYASAVGASGRVVSFEADRPLATRLQSEADRLGLSQCDVLNKALGGAVGVAQFEVAASPEHNSGLGSLSPDGAAGEGTVSVEVGTLDQVLGEYGSPSLVVMDIQGGELDALRGGAQTLAQARPVIVLEVESESLVRLGGSAEEVLDLLHASGYDCWRFSRFGLRPITEVEPDELGDWLAVPREAVADLLPRLRSSLRRAAVTPPGSRLSPLSRG